MDPLDVGETPIPKAVIRDEASAQNWVEELVRDMLLWRRRCDVHIPDPTDMQVQVQRRALWTFLSKQGQVVGALKTLRMAGLISDRCYKELNQQAINSLIPSQVGQV